MSVCDRQGPAVPDNAEGSGGDGTEPPNSDDPGRRASGAEATDAPSLAAAAAAPSVDPHRDARALVRLVQCQQCSRPLRQPLTLACGNSLCRSCLPPLHKRENITYPAVQGRAEGFMCPFAACGQEHALGDCGPDVALSKLLERVTAEMARVRPLTPDATTLLDERPRWRNVVDSSEVRLPHSRVLSGGRLVATFTLAELGELAYDAEVAYQTCSPTGEAYAALDRGMLEHLREATRSELDCQVCFALLLDPITLACGHTFCRKCVARVLDHAPTCPACRRPLVLTPGALQTAAANQRLAQLLRALCPEQVAARLDQVADEEADMVQNQQIPLFVCTLAYPRIPAFLHIFEPRYRLMIRRAMEADRRFGMMAYNSRGEVQGELGATQFLAYGTLLEIVNMHLLPDGRSVIETVGVSRFRVLEQGMRDGYIVGRVERIDDVPLAEEEGLEAAQVGAAVLPPAALPEPSTPQTTTTSSWSAWTGASTGADDATVGPPLENLPTAELVDICTTFIRRMRAASAHWLADHILQAYGPMPDDPAVFPYWFASVLPINEAEKYRLLPTRSVRARLLICAEWVRRVQRTRWYARLHELAHPTGSPEAPVPSSDATSATPPSPLPAPAATAEPRSGAASDAPTAPPASASPAAERPASADAPSPPPAAAPASRQPAPDPGSRAASLQPEEPLVPAEHLSPFDPRAASPSTAPTTLPSSQEQPTVPSTAASEEPRSLSEVRRAEPEHAPSVDAPADESEVVLEPGPPASET